MKRMGLIVALVLAVVAGLAWAEDTKLDVDGTKVSGLNALTGVTQTDAQKSNLMGQGPACMEYKWTPLGGICCKICCKPTGCICCPGYYATHYRFTYWEPSEIIEVSCRTGYSKLAPNGVPSRLSNFTSGGGDAAKMPQSCVGFSKNGNMHWFFEARVWAINGGDGGLRHQAMGGVNGEKARQCDMNSMIDTHWPGIESGDFWGYGVKWPKFRDNRGPANGPAGSWEAYISDKDPSWAPAQPQFDGEAGNLKECKPGSNDLPNCWGKITENGWVTHSNPKVAAALVAWRAHLKAVQAKKVSPPNSKGYKMMMDFPYQKYSGPFAASMGIPNGGKTGSACFQPGDAGPEWYGGYTPDQIPAMITQLKPGDMGQDAEINSGIYIFTIWVNTTCHRFVGMIETTNKCHYMEGT